MRRRSCSSDPVRTCELNDPGFSEGLMVPWFLDSGVCEMRLGLGLSPVVHVVRWGELSEAGLVALTVVQHFDELEQLAEKPEFLGCLKP